MKSFVFFLLIWVLTNSTNTTYSVPVSSDCSQKLSLALSNLSQELQYFSTPKQNKNNLYKRVIITQQYLDELKSQMSQYNNVIIGQNNSVNGSKNIIVGSYNSITGNNNFVFVQSYTGKANGDLLLQQWRIDLTKTNLILVDPNLAISFLNQQQNRDYLTLMTKNRVSYGYGSNIDISNIFTLIRMDDDPINPNNILNTQKVNQSTISSLISSPSPSSSHSINNFPNYGQSSSNSGSYSSYQNQNINSQDQKQSQPQPQYQLQPQYNGGYPTNIPSTSSTKSQVQYSNWSSNNGQSSQSSISNYNQQSSFSNPYTNNSNKNGYPTGIPMPKSLAQLNSLFGYRFQTNIPTQTQFKNYNTGNSPGAVVSNQVIATVNKGNFNPYGNLRVN